MILDGRLDRVRAGGIDIRTERIPCRLRVDPADHDHDPDLDVFCLAVERRVVAVGPRQADHGHRRHDPLLGVGLDPQPVDDLERLAQVVHYLTQDHSSTVPILRMYGRTMVSTSGSRRARSRTSEPTSGDPSPQNVASRRMINRLFWIRHAWWIGPGSSGQPHSAVTLTDSAMIGGNGLELPGHKKRAPRRERAPRRRV